MMDLKKDISSLWCKTDTRKIVYSTGNISTIGDCISFRSFELETDLSLIHHWVNQDYTRTFWQMRGSVGLLRSCYQCILQNPFAHSFIGLVGSGPICQFDIYKVAVDELANHVVFDEQD